MGKVEIEEDNKRSIIPEIAEQFLVYYFQREETFLYTSRKLSPCNLFLF